MRAELMRYRNDSLSFYLAILGLALDACLLMLIYSSPGVTCVDGFGKIIGVDILFNIIFLLAAFLTAEKVKTYTLNWCWTSLVLGLLQLPRLALPISLFAKSQLSVVALVMAIIFLVGSSASLIGCCVSSYFKSHKLDKHLKETSAKGE